MRTIIIGSLLAAFAGVSPVAAQQAAPPVPQVVTGGDVDIKPDRAQVLFSVETRASTAAAAAAENGRRQRAVLDTLQRLGVAPDQLQTAYLQVTPEMVYPGQGLPPKVSGYVARNSVRVEVLKLDQTGILVDAGLAKGSTGIGGLSFYSSKAAEARREALSRAVVAARQDAEAMAKAAGYQLGELLEIVSNSSSDGPVLMGMAPRAMEASSDMRPTPVNPGEIKVSQTVTVRWAVKL
jgi:uncharacterized protein